MRKRLFWRLLPAYLFLTWGTLVAALWLLLAIGQAEVAAATRVSQSPGADSDSRAQVRARLFWAGIGLAVAGGGFSYFAARRASRPIEELSAAAGKLAAGDFGQRVPAPDAAELAMLAGVLNQMARQLEERGDLLGRQGYEQEAILASMAEGVLAVDSRERVISLNRAAAALIGARLTDIRGRSLQEVIRNSELQSFAQRALASPSPIETEVTLRGDPERVLRVRGAALYDNRRRSIGAVIVLNDITHFRHLENVRRDFVANVSHELKTPISAIKGFVETLLEGALNDPEQGRHFLQIVARHADRLNAIIEDLLSLSQIEESEEAGDLKLAPTPIRMVLEAALEDCQSKARERQIEVQLECDPQLEAAINSPLLEQAVSNLIDNAIKHSEPGATVQISAHQTPAEVLIAVGDRGCGIDQQHLPRLFERFYQVEKGRSGKLGGTGLGLAIVKHIVQAHKGHVTVHSTPGKGSAFTIHLVKREG